MDGGGHGIEVKQLLWRRNSVTDNIINKRREKQD
jgi:hypothetical protein